MYPCECGECGPDYTSKYEVKVAVTFTVNATSKKQAESIVRTMLKLLDPKSQTEVTG